MMMSIKNRKSITSSTIIHAKESFIVKANQYGATKNVNINKLVVTISQNILNQSSGRMMK